MSTFMLKIIALVLMVIDHIGYYFPGTPIWLRLLGRGSYPLFLFCMVWGYHYTKNRKVYLLRLYLMSIFMTFFVYSVDKYFPTAAGYGNHNIFLPMFLVGVIISVIEIYDKDRKKGYLLLGAIFFSQVFYYMVPNVFPFARDLSGDLITGIIPNLVLNEYGLEFVVLGVLMYFLKERKELFSIMYILFCISQFSTEMMEMGMAIQWFMIIALPLMLKYNNQKGYSMKYFFYVFYPAHSFLLFYLVNFVLRNN